MSAKRSQAILEAAAEQLAVEFSGRSTDDVRWVRWLDQMYTRYGLSAHRFEVITGIDRRHIAAKTRVARIILSERGDSDAKYSERFIAHIEAIRDKYEHVQLTREEFPATNWEPDWKRVWFGDDEEKNAPVRWRLKVLTKVLNGSRLGGDLYDEIT